MKNNKGFTLVELIVSIMLYSLILVLFTTSVLAFTRLFKLVAKLDDVANDTETIYIIIDKAYREKEGPIVLNNNVITIDGIDYYFDRPKRAFFRGDNALVVNENIVSLFIYDYTMINNTYEFRIVYYKNEVLQELYFILGDF